MATYTVDKIAYGGNTYNLQDAGALQLTGGTVTGPVTFGDTVSVDDLSVGTLSATGNATFTNNLQVNTINGVAVGSSPQFTDTVTSDTKVSTAAVTSGTTYYPVVGTNTTGAATKYYDRTGLTYAGTNGTTSAVGSAIITLGNSTASGTANNKQGKIGLYGSTAYLTTIVSGAPTAANTLTLPTATGTIALTSNIPSAGTTATAVGTSASGGSASTYSKSDHVHNITSSTITSALGYTPYNSTNPSGYLTASSTLDATKLSGTIPTACYNDTKVTQTNSYKAEFYPLLYANSANDTTETAGVFKTDRIGVSSSINSSGQACLKVGNTRFGHARFYAQSDRAETFGTGLSIGTEGTDAGDLFCRVTSGNPQIYLRHWSAAKGTGGTVTDQWVNSQIGIGLSGDTPSIYLQQFSAHNTSNTYLRLRNNDLYINDGTGHSFNATDIDKVHNIGTITSDSFTKSSVASGTSLVSLGTFSIPVGSYIVFVTVYFPSMGTGKRVCMDVSGTGVPLNTADVRASSGTTNYLKCQFAITCSAATTITVKGYQNSGSSLNLTVNYQYIRVA